MSRSGQIVRSVVTTVAFALCLSVPANAQLPEKFTNLQYFPKTTDRESLIQTMRGFSFSLGVRCEYCHAGKGGNGLEKMDWASDEKEPKKAARAMLRMVDTINQDYVAKLGSQTRNRISCVTCHHGLSKPKGIAETLAETLDTKGIPEAIAQYKDLRKSYYGGAQYDFSETPLNQLSENLNRSGKTKEAVAMMEMNAESNAPLSEWGNGVLAMAHVANKDVDKARADFQKILEKDPENKWARKQLDDLSQKSH
jgi:hypothetical protein